MSPTITPLDRSEVSQGKASIRRLLFVLSKFGIFWNITSRKRRRAKLRGTKSRLQKSWGDYTGRLGRALQKSATAQDTTERERYGQCQYLRRPRLKERGESAKRTSKRASRNASLEVEVNPIERGPHSHLPEKAGILPTESATESANA